MTCLSNNFFISDPENAIDQVSILLAKWWRMIGKRKNVNAFSK